jgi:hypothetical protein
MRRLAFLFVFALASFATPASAQYLPEGTWRETCRDPYLRGDTLGALCMDLNRRWRESRIDVSECRGGRIENDDGRLQCERRGGWGGGGWGGNAGGTFRASCRDIRQDGPMIRARCQDQDGNWRTSRIDARECRQDIANIDGRLACIEYGDRWGGR